MSASSSKLKVRFIIAKIFQIDSLKDFLDDLHKKFNQSSKNIRSQIIDSTNHSRKVKRSTASHLKQSNSRDLDDSSDSGYAAGYKSMDMGGTNNRSIGGGIVSDSLQSDEDRVIKLFRNMGF